VTATARRSADGQLVADGVVDAALPDEYGCAWVLLLLHEQPSSRQELGERLRLLGLVEHDPGRLPGTLRRLEWGGLVRAVAGDADAPATTYHLTALGTERLGAVAVDVRATRALLGWFLARCGERFAGARGARG